MDHYTHLPTPEGWMAELAKARSMQPYIYNTIQDYIATRCEKLAQGFYTAATWPGIEPRRTTVITVDISYK